MNKEELIAAVRAHALANYEKDGWDFIVESYDDEEIARVIGNARTAKSAISAAKRAVVLHHEQRLNQRDY